MHFHHMLLHKTIAVKIGAASLPSLEVGRKIIASLLLYFDAMACLKSVRKIAYSLTSPENLGIFGFSILKPQPALTGIWLTILELVVII